MKLLEIFGNSSKVFSRCFYVFINFRKIFGNLRKFSEIFGNLQKCSKIFGKFPDVIGNVRSGSQELKSFGAGF